MTKAPRHTLPIDILCCIIAAVDINGDSRSLRTLCYTSRLFRELATPVLYGSIRVKSYGALYRLSWTLDQNAELGAYSRRFVETSPFLYDEGGPNAVLPGVLKRMPRLRELHIASPVDVDAEGIFRHTPHLRTLVLARPTPSLIADLRHLRARLVRVEIGMSPRHDHGDLADFVLHICDSVQELSIDVDVLQLACRTSPGTVWARLGALRLQGAPPQRHEPPLPLAYRFPNVQTVSWRSTSDYNMKPSPLALEGRSWRGAFWSSASSQVLNVVGGLFSRR